MHPFNPPFFLLLFFFKKNKHAFKKRVLVFWPHSVFGQNHLCVKML
jgi:hypothetical protein